MTKQEAALIRSARPFASPGGAGTMLMSDLMATFASVSEFLTQLEQCE